VEAVLDAMVRHSPALDLPVQSRLHTCVDVGADGVLVIDRKEASLSK